MCETEVLSFGVVIAREEISQALEWRYVSSTLDSTGIAEAVAANSQ